LFLLKEKLKGPPVDAWREPSSPQLLPWSISTADLDGALVIASLPSHPSERRGRDQGPRKKRHLGELSVRNLWLEPVFEQGDGFAISSSSLQRSLPLRMGREQNTQALYPQHGFPIPGRGAI